MLILSTPLVPTLENDVNTAVTVTERVATAAGASLVMNHALAVFTAESNETFWRVAEREGAPLAPINIYVCASN